jgi:hypothetical protein
MFFMKRLILFTLVFMSIFPHRLYAQGTQGPNAPGTPGTGNPVQVGGRDSTGAVRVFKTDSTGQVYIANPGGGGTTKITDQTGAYYLLVNSSGQISIASITGSLPAGSAVIGAVTISGTPAVTVAPTTATLTDCSGSITTGGTAQTLMASNTSRTYFLIQNTSLYDEWISFTGTAGLASAGSYRLQRYGVWVSDPGTVSTGAISIWGSTTGQTFSASQH